MTNTTTKGRYNRLRKNGAVERKGRPGLGGRERKERRGRENE